MIPRKGIWKQDTPREQVAALLAACQGDTSNAVEGIGRLDSQLVRLSKNLADAQLIIQHWIHDGSWSEWMSGEDGRRK